MNRVWLITGASSGFGRAITEAALAAAHPGQVEGRALDVTDTAAIEAAVQDVIARHGRIDVLVNNAGRAHVGAAEETSDAELRSLFDVHVFGPAALTRAVLPSMRERRSGAIVQMSSMGGQLSFAGFSAYSGTKFALEGMSEALADEVRPLGIKVLIVEPGAFRTGLFGSTTDSEQIGDYSATVGTTRQMIQVSTAIDAPQTPLRLPLGDDAVDAISGHLDKVKAELTTWEKTARDTRLDTLD
jgi:NAD(P)-dependent dehydrogenase (short-subunit alcohol dehydrogenase family)